MGTFGFVDTSYDDQLSTCSDADQPLFTQITNSSSELSFAFQKLSKQQLSSAIPATRFQWKQKQGTLEKIFVTF